jgi:guanylate kinase
MSNSNLKSIPNSNSKQGKLIIISGPSGVGKSCVCDALKKNIPNLLWSISATTREKRQGEVQGQDYFFIPENEFLEKLKNNEFLEHAKVHEFYYATPRKPIDDAIQRGYPCLLDIDVQGAWNIKKNSEYDLVLIFIEPPSLKELESRLIKRGRESLQQIQKRLANASSEMQASHFYTYHVVNDVLEKTIEKVLSITQQELSS